MEKAKKISKKRKEYFQKKRMMPHCVFVYLRQKKEGP
jgi:hypothetical protein